MCAVHPSRRGDRPTADWRRWVAAAGRPFVTGLIDSCRRRPAPPPPAATANQRCEPPAARRHVGRRTCSVQASRQTAAVARRGGSGPPVWARAAVPAVPTPGRPASGGRHRLYTHCEIAELLRSFGQDNALACPASINVSSKSTPTYLICLQKARDI